MIQVLRAGWLSAVVGVGLVTMLVGIPLGIICALIFFTYKLAKHLASVPPCLLLMWSRTAVSIGWAFIWLT